MQEQVVWIMLKGEENINGKKIAGKLKSKYGFY